MRDQYLREIDYLRISVTDRCNLRCRYCMPDGVPRVERGKILRYEEILRLCRLAVELGIVNFKLTGGEPLVRQGIEGLIGELKHAEGVRSVTMTTNGVLLEEKLPALLAAGLDAVNVSLDTLNRQRFRELTGFDELEHVLRGIHAASESGIRTRINCVLLRETGREISAIAGLARERGIDVRFIELMPIGLGRSGGGSDRGRARELLLADFPDLAPCTGEMGNGPAHYEKSAALRGRIGWIDAMSHSFCAECNRVRLTSTGFLKPCLCYGEGADLGGLMRAGISDEELKNALRDAIYRKPRAHCFLDGERISERNPMSEIGG